MEENKEIGVRKEKIKNWFKDRHNLLLFLLMLFTIVIRLYFFFKLGNQPIWWDEGDYLSIPKVWALGMDKPEWWGHFTGMRPLFIPIIWFLFMKIGSGELFMRFFTLLIPSVITVYLVYAVGRDLYNKKIGLIAGFIMSIYWVHLFYTFRLLTDIPALFLGMLTLYYFSRYIKIGEKKGLYLAVLFGVLAFAARFPHASVLFSCFLFLLITEKTKFFKKRINWKAILLIFIFLSPYIIYFIMTNFYAFQFYSGLRLKAAVRMGPALYIFKLFPSLFKPVFFILMFVGLFTLLKVILNFDLFLKQKDKKLNSDFFVLLLIIIHVLLYFVLIRAANDRWLLMLMPPLFFLVAKGFYTIENFIKKYSKHFAVFIVVILVLLGGYYQLRHARQLIEIKKDTYKEIKLAGEWLKENTSKDAKVITASIVQNQYYSGRQSYDFFANGTNKTLFEEKVKRINPDYLIISVFEPAFTPEWAYQYPQEKNLTIVKAYLATKQYERIYGIKEGSPMLVLYKF